VSSQADPVSVSSSSAKQTELIGARLARALPSLATQYAVAYLSGELGAGKTTLARGFLQGRGFGGAVRSPTYTLLECYELPDLVVVHLDLYRIEDESELEALGWRDFLTPGHVLLIEWPDRGGRRLAPADVSVALQAEVSQHRLALRSHSPLGSQWLHALVELCAGTS
jgi:tRNA threonylcarbamoyladenosine biosynthesis protein TsaE